MRLNLTFLRGSQMFRCCSVPPNHIHPWNQLFNTHQKQSGTITHLLIFVLFHWLLYVTWCNITQWVPFASIFVLLPKRNSHRKKSFDLFTLRPTCFFSIQVSKSTLEKFELVNPKKRWISEFLIQGLLREFISDNNLLTSGFYKVWNRRVINK